MDWIEVTIKTNSESVELISDVLVASGINGFEIIDHAENRKFLLENTKNWDYCEDELLDEKEGAELKFYVCDFEGENQIADVIAGLQELSQFGVTQDKYSINRQVVSDEGWLDNWKKFYKPFKVGNNIVIRPVWEEYCGPEIVFTINPGHLFGTGLHQTTKMCIQMLEKHVSNGYIISDIGTGSGILSVISLLLGAESVVACDIEHTAGAVVYENAELNGVRESIQVFTGDVLSDDSLVKKFKKSDIVVANIVADVINELMKFVPDILKENGCFIASGIIDKRRSDVLEAASISGFSVVEELELDGWHCFVFKLS